MSELLNQHRAHKDRLARLGAMPVRFQEKVYPVVKPKPIKAIKPIDARLYYRHMWMWDLVNSHTGVGEYRPTIGRIIEAVGLHFGVTVDDLYSNRRTLDVSRPRQVAMYLARVMTRKTFPEIGRRMGDRDHTTVLHGNRKIESILKISPEMQRHVAELKEELSRP